MAEIRVEKEKRSLGWLWALLALLLLALAAWWFLTQRTDPVPAPADTTAPRDTIGALPRTPDGELRLAWSATFQGGPNGTT